ncbi:MAG: class I SAM-dependent methyltransferase [Opitutaceae bacterium]
MSGKPHSADWFGETRNFWWNHDFLRLMSVRWDLANVKKALDVGCGIGVWGRCLAPFLPSDCVLTGIDRESRWIEEARKRSAGIENIKALFQQGEAERLPFLDNSFDLVTCQTLLIHIKDPVAVIREMIRVLVPGGLLVIVEPSNIATSASSIDLKTPISELIGLLEFQLICERGKMNLGEGFNSAGPCVAGWLSELDIEDIKSYMSDKTSMFMPPYESARERAIIREVGEMSQRDFWIWNREDALRYFLAGGGIQDAFDARWSMALAKVQEVLSEIQKGTLRSTSAPIILLVSGRKKKPNSRLDPTGSSR